MIASGYGRSRAPRLGVLLNLALALAVVACAPAAPREPGAGAAAPAAVTPASAPAAPAPPLKARIGTTVVAAALAPPFLAQDAGIFERNGLEAEIVQVGPGPLAVQALMAGEMDFAYNTGSSLVAANVGGADLVMLAGGVNTMIFSIVAGPGIERVEDLRGKRLGITRIGTSSDFAARYALRQAGLQADSDVQLIQMSDIPAILQGMVAGALDAGVLSHPTLVNAKQQGYRVVVDVGSLGVEYQHTGLMAARRYLEANPEAARRVLESHVEAIHKFKTDKAAALDSLARFTQLSDAGILEDTWQAYGNTYFERVPYATVAGLQFDVDALAATVPAAAGVRAESFVDNRFMDELVKGGLIERLYGR
jgi:ABC-type nitrate/sulfonate/bicarbonate transport system substrate-binding protein